MDEWIEETQTDQNYVRYNLYACPKQMGTQYTYYMPYVQKQRATQVYP